MENAFNNIEPLFDRTEDFVKTSFELYKLKTLNKSAEVVSNIVSRGIVVIFLTMFFVFASIGLALWVGDLLGKPYLGFFCVSTFYFLLGIAFFFVFHKFIKRKVRNSIISEIIGK